MNIDAFAGSGAEKAALAEALRAGKLPHSLLICAEEGCGAGYFARLLAADLIAPGDSRRAGAVLAGRDPDCLELRGQGKSGQIPVSAVREARAEAQNTSLAGERRVVLVYEAEKMAAAAANALLKILEEPPDGITFLLTTHAEARLLPTIRSRCGRVQLSAPAPAECAAVLEAHGVPRASAERLAAVWEGRCGRALECTDPVHRPLFETAGELTAAAGRGDTYRLMALLAPYEKEEKPRPDEAGADAGPAAEPPRAPLKGGGPEKLSRRQELFLILDYTLWLLRRILLSGAPADGLTLQRAAAAEAAVLRTAEHLRANVNAKLELTLLAMRLGEG